MDKKWVFFEGVLTTLILAGILYSAAHLALFSYLPSPFFYEPSDTFADWFNTAFWSRQVGVYDTWRSVYPPLSFIVLRMLTNDQCYAEFRDLESSAGYDARSCDWFGLSMIFLFFIINVVLTFKTLRKINPETAAFRTICVAVSMPMLNALERGNLLLVTYTCVILAFGPLLASARLRWFFAGLAVNFKVYLIGAVFALLLKRRWLWVECAFLTTLVTYVSTVLFFGAGTPAEIWQNLQFFAVARFSELLDGWAAFTYIPFLSVIEIGTFPLAGLIGSFWVEVLAVVLPAFRWMTIAVIVLAALIIWFRPGRFTPARAVFMGVAMALSFSESGIYTLIFIFLFVFLDRGDSFGLRFAIVLCYLLAVPIDWAIDILPETQVSSYFTNSEVLISREIVIGPFLRPFVIMIIIWTMALTTIWEGLKKDSALLNRKVSSTI